VAAAPDGRDVIPGAARRPVVMGVLNVTPDSFSDGGRFLDPGAAVAHGERLLAEGADWLDVGGESTRPGARPVPPDEQIRRVVPVVRALADRAPISIDTASAAVAAAALEAGATVINDVTGLVDPEMAPLAARAGATLVVMHLRGTPADMQADTRYGDLVGEVLGHLRARLDRAREAGVADERLIADPGLGFGKAPLDNPRLVAAVPALRGLGVRVLVGGSRKAFVGRLTGVDRPEERVAGSVGVALAAAALGADVVRVHDVAPTVHALATFLACLPPAALASGAAGEAGGDGVGATRR
jgi:dihydropteroate synthase